jgi:hypothetical protein
MFRQFLLENFDNPAAVFFLAFSFLWVEGKEGEAHAKMYFFHLMMRYEVSYATRQSRIHTPGALHHIGIKRRQIFEDNCDRDNFMERFGGILPKTKPPCYP